MIGSILTHCRLLGQILGGIDLADLRCGAERAELVISIRTLCSRIELRGGHRAHPAHSLCSVDLHLVFLLRRHLAVLVFGQALFPTALLLRFLLRLAPEHLLVAAPLVRSAGVVVVNPIKGLPRGSVCFERTFHELAGGVDDFELPVVVAGNVEDLAHRATFHLRAISCSLILMISNRIMRQTSL
ncbi:hypothetical protein AGR7A_Lc120268 [Agrobacterium deltaense NCPPB 1641]|uniref:Uncharacterized protein n=1 Tax=Agrobacterium deltaense NCPPB 1641 TaxID=1183425 RepID=A0A1S7TW92_9HYPH|nr:hypothetical protein AGR7A_Lc120268 [Agrobacterium deltaense NCPPB 1641]